MTVTEQCNICKGFHIGVCPQLKNEGQKQQLSFWKKLLIALSFPHGDYWK